MRGRLSPICVARLTCSLPAFLTHGSDRKVSVFYSSSEDFRGTFIPFVSLPLQLTCHIFSFFGLFGIYFSLQYLSLSDATVITFLAPTCTAIAGAVFLHETLRKTELYAACLYPTFSNRVY
jgi:drug/metabolite transporter (DMT)-like permease